MARKLYIYKIQNKKMKNNFSTTADKMVLPFHGDLSYDRYIDLNNNRPLTMDVHNLYIRRQRIV